MPKGTTWVLCTRVNLLKLIVILIEIISKMILILQSCKARHVVPLGTKKNIIYQLLMTQLVDVISYVYSCS